MVIGSHDACTLSYTDSTVAASIELRFSCTTTMLLILLLIPNGVLCTYPSPNSTSLVLPDCAYDEFIDKLFGNGILGT